MMKDSWLKKHIASKNFLCPQKIKQQKRMLAPKPLATKI